MHDEVGEAGGDAADQCGDFCVEGEFEEVEAVVGLGGGLEGVEVFGLDNLFGLFGLVAGAERHQRLVLVLGVFASGLLLH